MDSFRTAVVPARCARAADLAGVRLPSADALVAGAADRSPPVALPDGEAR
ncbi:hypothetical protein ACIO6T_40100 [Streptomyces sp. NPDC087532]